MKRVFSAGGIVFNSQGQVLLIKAGSLRDESILHWKFPKGHIEKDESSKDAATREVEEETGVQARIIEKVGDSKYVYPYKGEKIFKVSIYFLMEYEGGELEPQIGEVEEVAWFDVNEALKSLSFSADKNLLKKAIEIRENMT